MDGSAAFAMGEVGAKADADPRRPHRTGGRLFLLVGEAAPQSSTAGRRSRRGAYPDPAADLQPELVHQLLAYIRWRCLHTLICLK
jgi:hypothetical protein